MKKIFTILFLFINLTLSATNYYVKNAGADGNTGLSDAQAWQTLSKVSGFTFSAGDTIFFKRGSTWRESLTVHNAGTAVSQIVYSSYGTGLSPTFLGSNQALSFADMTGYVWKSATSLSDPASTASVFFVGLDGVVHWGDEKSDTASLVNEYDWVWVANYIYCYAATDPDVRYTSVEIPQRTPIINTASKEYITIDSLRLFYSAYIGIDDGNYPDIHIHGLQVLNCHIAYGGNLTVSGGKGYGTSAIYSSSLFQGDTIHSWGRRSLSMNCYVAITVEDVIVEKCVFYDGNHTTGVDIYADANTTVNNITVRKNLFYDDPANVGTVAIQQIFVQKSSSAAAMTNININDNIFQYPIGSAVQLERVGSAYIYNNTFYGHNNNATSNNYHISVTVASTNIYIKNNIFHTLKANDAGGCELYVSTGSSQLYTEVHPDYNVYYRNNATTLRVINANGTSYHMNDIATVRTALGYEAHGQFVDPTLTSATDYHLLLGSPAIVAGIGVGLTTDYEGSPWAVSPSIGAYEYNVTPLPPPDLPTVTTTSISVLWTREGTSGGNVTDDGGGTVSDRGICWKTTANPVITDSHVHVTGTTGTYTANIKGLSANTVYHIRAFVTNETGTSYGADIEFTTLESSINKSSGKAVTNGGKVLIIK